MFVSFQDYILHNVMLIFTFVGSGLLRQDDSHSFQVITHTITTVIPALIQVKIWWVQFGLNVAL